MKLSSGIGAVAVFFSLAEDALGHGYVQQIKAGSEYIEAWNPYKVVLFFQCKSCHLRSCFFLGPSETYYKAHSSFPRQWTYPRWVS